MELVGTKNNQFVFEIGRREKRLLFEVLKLYPLVPAAQHRLSKSGNSDENQRLLDESLAAQRGENKRCVARILNESECLTATQTGYRLTLAAAKIDWLLQVLNDVRVGSWLALGSPDPADGVGIPPDEKSAAHFWAMEVAGGFEMVLIEAMSGRAPP